MKTLTLSKPLNPSRRKPRQRITRAQLVALAAYTDTPEERQRTVTVKQIKHWLKKKVPSAIGKCKPPTE